MDQVSRIGDGSPFDVQRFAVAEYTPDVGGYVPDDVLLRAGRAIPNVDRFRNRIMLATEMAFHRDPHACLSLIAESFGFQGSVEWNDQYESYRDLFRMFFRPTSNLPAWVSIIPFRIPFQFRAPPRAKAVVQEPGRVVNPNGIESRHLRSARLELGFGIGELPLDGFVFTFHPAARYRDVRMVEVHRRRRVLTDQAYYGVDRMFFPAIPQEDHPSSCMIPVQLANFDPVMRANRTPSFLMARMQPEPPWYITQVVVTLHPGDGRTVSFVPGRRPLEMFLRQYDLEHQLLCQAGESIAHAR